MFRTPLLKIALLVSLTFSAVAPVWAQWATPVIDGSIGSGEYGTNNSLSNAGNTGQTWYMTWDATNLYVGVVNANLSEGAVLYIKGNPPNPHGSPTAYLFRCRKCGRLGGYQDCD